MKLTLVPEYFLSNSSFSGVRWNDDGVSVLEKFFRYCSQPISSDCERS